MGVGRGVRLAVHVDRVGYEPAVRRCIDRGAMRLCAWARAHVDSGHDGRLDGERHKVEIDELDGGPDHEGESPRAVERGAGLLEDLTSTQSLERAHHRKIEAQERRLRGQSGMCMSHVHVACARACCTCMSHVLVVCSTWHSLRHAACARASCLEYHRVDEHLPE